MAQEKEHLNVVFIGHIDHGKSTLIGRLLFDAGNIDPQVMRKLKEKASNLGKTGFEFAFMMDHLKEEQERGVTINLAHQKFESDKYYYTIIDAPGHADFIKNMITGVSQADAAVLAVAATDGVNEQTTEHTNLAKTFGINQLLVAVNKMDLVDYSQEKFNAVKEQVQKLTKPLSFGTVDFVPVSALQGENIAKSSENMTWWTEGTLLQKLDQFETKELPVDLPFRLPVQDVYNIKGVGVVPVGRVETGVLKPNTKVVAVPGRVGTGITGEVKDIEMHHEKVSQARPGDNVGFSTRFKKGDLARGDVLGYPDNPPTLASEFKGQIIVLHHPSVITVGYSPVFHINTDQVACRFEQIEKKVAPQQEDNPDYIKKGDAAIVKFVPLKPVVIEKNSEFPKLSRFAIRDSGKTVAAGQCTEVVKKELKF